MWKVCLVLVGCVVVLKVGEEEEMVLLGRRLRRLLGEEVEIVLEKEF